jgi:hypothetical protein
MHPAVTRAAPWANGGSIPSLRMFRFRDAPEVPMAERWSPKPEATGSIPVRRAVFRQRDDVAERRRRGAATSAHAGSIPAVVSLLVMVAVAQLVRAPGCEPGSCGFNSHRSPCRFGCAELLL